MQYSVVNYKTVKENSDFRIDADYYHPIYLREDSLVAKFKKIPLSEFSFITDGQHGYHEVDENSPISHLTAKNAKNWFADTDSADRLARWVDDKNKRSSLRENDLILSTRGTVGFCALVFQDILPANIDQDIARIAIKEKLFLPEFLLVYFNSQFGQDWIKRNISGMVQQGLSLQKVRTAPIPLFNDGFQKIIRDTILKAKKYIDHSKSLYSQAERLLLSELGLLEWKPKHTLSFVKSFSDTKDSNRFDAEYFQPKYEEIVEAINKYKGGFDELSNLVKIKKSIEPGSEAYQENGILFVRVSNLSKFELSDNNQQFISEELYNELKTHQPKKGEILLSKDATPGMAYFLNEETQKMIVSGGILRLKIDSKQILPEYLTLVLNSVIVQEQIERDAGGSIINHWRPDQVKATLIPILKEDKQKEIKELVEKSFNDRKLSKSLLEIVKRGVEMAIEKDEQEAEKWIENELRKLELD